MADKTKIQVEVETKLTESRSDIKTLKDKGAINNKIEAQIEGILKQLDSLGQVSKPSLQQLSKINALFNQLTDILLKVAQSSKATSKEFQELIKKLETQTLDLDKARSERGNILKKGRINKGSGKYELFTTYQDETIKQANIQNSKGNSIKTAETFYKKFDTEGNPIQGAFQDPAAAKNLYDSLKQTQETNALRLAELNQAIADYQAEIKKSQEALKAQADKEGSTLTAGIIDRKISANEVVQVEKDQIHAAKDAEKDTASPEGFIKKQNNSLGKAFKQFTLYAVAVRMAKQALREAVGTIKELDKYLTEQAMVTGKTREETYALVGQYQELALACGATTKEIAQVTTEYMKQGKSTEDALVLTEAAVKAAKVARVSVGDSVNYLTTALNGFRLEAAEAMRVSDIFASVAAASATDYDELAIALSKVASQANLAGMSIEYTTALLTKGLETTREAPETMGTALKTIIARMREMSDYGETLEGDTDVNNVESQLAYVGIALKNEQGELRATEEVLDELGRKWETLNKNQQAALARALAGTRQQSRLIAMMDDYERVIELQEIAERSTGATSAQAGVYLEGMEASLNKIQVAWEKIIMTVTDSEIIINVFSFIGSLLDKIGDFLSTDFGMVASLTAAAIIGLNILNTKIQEGKIAKINAKLQAQQYLTALKEQKAESDTLILEKKAGLEKKKQLKTTLEEKKAKGLATANDLTRLGMLDKEIAADAKFLEQEELRNKSLQTEINLQQTQMNNLFGIQGAFSGIIQVASVAFGLFKGMAMLSALIVKLKKKEGQETVKNTLKEKAAAAVAKIKAAFGMADSASDIPWVGWVIAAGILATLVGIAIATSVASFNKYQQSADAAAENINKISNEIYTLNETANAIANVTSQFDKLDNKVIKTKEDIEEMNSLLESAGDSLSSDEDAKYNQETYKNLQDNESRRRYLELAQRDAESQLSQKRQEQLNIINALSATERAKLLNDDTTNSAYLESQSAIRATVNSYIYDTIDALEKLGSYTEEELKYTEDLTVALMEEAKALDILDYANNKMAVTDLVQELAKLDSTEIFMDENYSFTERIQAFRDIKDALAEDTVAWEAFSAAYQEWDTFAQMNEDILEFIESANLSIDQINELYAGYSKLQKAGLEVSKEAYTTALESSMHDLDSNLSNFESVIATHFGYMLTEGEDFADQWNAIISAIGDTFAIGILDMGQNMEKFQNTINDFYKKSSEWAEMKESEKMEFIADNAELFAGEGGEKLLQAFESGDYNAIEQALKDQMGSDDGATAQRLAEVRRTLAVEEARVGEDRNAAYIQSLKEYEAYLMNGNNLYKASLELRLEQEEAQLDKYKEYLEKQQEALTDSLEKRKEAYQDYFDSINENEEDEDYEEEANRLITNISKLSSSTNADAMQKTAELEQELRDLEEERLQTLRERAQEAVIENIDTTIEEINDKFDKLLESNQALLLAMRGDLDSPLEFLTDMIVSKADDGLTAYGMEEFLQELQGTYGSVIGNDVFENMTVREENGQLILNINGQEITLGAEDQQSVYMTVMEALRAVGLR